MNNGVQDSCIKLQKLGKKNEWKTIFVIVIIVTGQCFSEMAKSNFYARWNWHLEKHVMIWEKGCCVPCVMPYVAQVDKEIMEDILHDIDLK